MIREEREANSKRIAIEKERLDAELVERIRNYKDLMSRTLLQEKETCRTTLDLHT